MNFTKEDLEQAFEAGLKKAIARDSFFNSYTIPDFETWFHHKFVSELKDGKEKKKDSL